MSNTGLLAFDKTIQHTNELLNAICIEFGWEGHKDIAYDALRAVLHTLRDRLTVEEAVQLAAQFPTLIRGMYYEGWNPSRVPRKMDKDMFYEEIRHLFPYNMDFTTGELIKGVMKVLSKYISDGKLEEIKEILPKKLESIISH